jgi:hypothetical protein
VTSHRHARAGDQGECFGHIAACADERTADGYAVRHYIEQRNRKFGSLKLQLNHSEPFLPARPVIGFIVVLRAKIVATNRALIQLVAHSRFPIWRLSY